MKQLLIAAIFLPFTAFSNRIDKATKRIIDSLQFQMIKTVCRIFASDPKKENLADIKEKIVHLQNGEYNKIPEFMKQLGYDDFAKKINKWKIHIENENDLSNIKTNIEGYLLGDSQDSKRTKIVRKNWPGFDLLYDDFERLFNEAKEILSKHSGKQESNDTTGNKALDSLKNEVAGIKNQIKKNIYWTYAIAVVVSAVLIVLYYLLNSLYKSDNNKKKNIQNTSTNDRIVLLEDRTDKIEKSIKDFENNNLASQNIETLITQKINSALVEMKERDGNPEGKATGKASQLKTKEDAPNDSITWYGKIISLDEKFISEYLVPEQDKLQVYILTCTGNSGTFCVSQSETAQEYAMSTNLLNDGCIFLNDPMPNCKIETKKPGAIILDTDGNWKITEKAKIKFI